MYSNDYLKKLNKKVNLPNLEKINLFKIKHKKNFIRKKMK